MKLRKTPIASAVTLALISMMVHAQQSDTQPASPAPQTEAPKPKNEAAKPAPSPAAPVVVAQTPTQPVVVAQAPPPATGTTPDVSVTVTGIRYSVEKSLQTKRNSDTFVEVVTAEDIGKLPDKNVADAVQRLPGVTISSAAGGEGGFDENDRVSIRGTNPSLTQTLINGHPVSSGDWFVLDQVGTVGRSVSFSLLPSELVSQVIVRKTATADLVEGGVAGAVDIITRKPLEFGKPLTFEASAQAVYADLPEKTDGQFSALVNWKNAAGTAGVMLQAFSQTRHLRRDGQEILGYAPIAPGSAYATAHPELAGVVYPTLIGSAFFEQKRERNGGLIDIQIQPTTDFMLDFSAFYSKMKADNYNRNWMFWGSHVINGGNGQLPTSFTVQNGTLTSAVFPNLGTPGNNAQYAIVDQILRPGTYSETQFYNLDARYRVNDRLWFTGQLGYTEGTGKTPKQDVFEGAVFNTGASYRLNGLGSGADVAFPNGNPSNFAGTSLDFIFGGSPVESKDKETYGQIDGNYALNSGVWTTAKFGLRGSEHTRKSTIVGQGPNGARNPFDPANLPAWNGETYPGNFASGIGGNFPRQPWMLSPGVLESWGDFYSNRDPVSRRQWPAEIDIKENIFAGYAMANLEGDRWAGNVGVRYVQTKEKVKVNVGLPSCPVLQPCPGVPDAITTSAFGTFIQQNVDHTYNDWMPSANLRYDLSRNLVGRLAFARTIARPDYSALGGAVALEDTTHTGNGGNPDLKPIRSNNYDAAIEWYFQPRALLAANLFYLDLKNYVGFGTHDQEFLDIRTNTFQTYRISSPINSSGKSRGFEVAYQQEYGYGFGLIANYTYSDAEETGGQPLVGASQNVYNIIGYWENYGWSARLAWTYRSKFFVGLDRSTPQFQDDTGTLAASVSYQLTDKIALTFDALNLNDPTLKYFAANETQPRAFYKNGRQYYAGIRVKL